MDEKDQGIMTYFEAEAHSFIVRIWREHRENPDNPGEWRGWIEHVQSEQRHYFRDFSDIPQIVSYFTGEISEFDDQVFSPIGPKGTSK